MYQYWYGKNSKYHLPVFNPKVLTAVLLLELDSVKSKLPLLKVALCSPPPDPIYN